MGHGLSYTTFEYSQLAVAAHVPPGGGAVNTSYTLSVRVTNTGAAAAAETVLFLHELWLSRVVRWERQLSGFTKVRLRPGESAVAAAAVERSQLAIWLEPGAGAAAAPSLAAGQPQAGGWWVEPGNYTLSACASTVDCRLTVGFEVQ